MRQVFYSFEYKTDNWRAAKIRNIWVVEWNKPAADNDWEEIKWNDKKIQEWIDDQLKWRSCTIVLIWERTYWRKWINYEIKKSWDDWKWVFWIYINKITDREWNQSKKGRNPFEYFSFWEWKFSNIVKVYDPPQITSPWAYNYIAENIENWIDEAIKIRKKYPS